MSDVVSEIISECTYIHWHVHLSKDVSILLLHHGFFSLRDLPFSCVFFQSWFDWKLIFGRMVMPCSVWLSFKLCCVHGGWSESIMLMVCFCVWKMRSAGDAKYNSTHFLNEGNPSVYGSTSLQVMQLSPWCHPHEGNTGRQMSLW